MSQLDTNNLQAASNDTLIEAFHAETNDRARIRIREEIDRRVLTKEKALELLKPFNARTEVSADAKYLWKRILIWFWVIPVAAAAILWLLHMTSVQP